MAINVENQNIDQFINHKLLRSSGYLGSK